MYELILDYAKKDEGVRCVYMNGSRANPNAPKDKYMDFDIVFIVKELSPYLSDLHWVDVFGKRLILQMPEAMRYPSGSGAFNWLMLFEDGNRIDLTLIPITKPELIGEDSETLVLLDKDGILPKFPPASDRDYLVREPDELFYLSCCNNFFWCMQNVAKGIVRDELSYAMQMYDYWVRNELNDMVSWYIGTQTDFEVSTGKLGKYFKTYLSAEVYEKYKKTYADSDYDHLWQAMFEACSLFRLLAKEVADYFNYTYPKEDDHGIMEYLKWMREEDER